MPGELRVPTLGESIFEATVGRWLKAPGEAVRAGEAVVELETDKVSLEVTAQEEGLLATIHHPTGDIVGIGDLLGTIAAAGTTVAASAPLAPGMPTAPGAPAVPGVSAALGAPAEAAAGTPEATVAAPEAAATPLARRLAEEHGVDLDHVRGSGVHGRITRDDILDQVRPSTAVSHSSPPAPLAPLPVPAPAVTPAPQALPTAPAPAVGAVTPGGSLAAGPATGESRQPTGMAEERVRMSRRRQTIARRLVEAQQTAAMLTTFNEADLGAVMELRARRRDAFKERHGVGLGFMSFFTRAAVAALKAYPRLNAELQGDEMVIKHYYDIGIAVGVEEGLVVPVVRGADRKSFAEIESEINDLATRARANTLRLEDLQGGTFTITNGGVFGSLLSTPILNTPQVGILGMHKIQERPVALKGEIVIRPMMYLALSYDHRIVDGREAVQFLVRIKELIEEPELLLLEG